MITATDKMFKCCSIYNNHNNSQIIGCFVRIRYLLIFYLFIIHKRTWLYDPNLVNNFQMVPIVLFLFEIPCTPFIFISNTEQIERHFLGIALCGNIRIIEFYVSLPNNPTKKENTKKFCLFFFRFLRFHLLFLPFYFFRFCVSVYLFLFGINFSTQFSWHCYGNYNRLIINKMKMC